MLYKISFYFFVMQKLYYSISEASGIVDEEQHILRYWEKEFDELKPKKNRAGNRIYSQKDIQLIKLIKSLIRDEKLSLKGAKDKFKKILESQNQSNSKLEQSNFLEKNKNTLPLDFSKSLDDNIILKKSNIQEIEKFLLEIKEFLNS